MVPPDFSYTIKNNTVGTHFTDCFTDFRGDILQNFKGDQYRVAVEQLRGLDPVKLEANMDARALLVILLILFKRSYIFSSLAITSSRYLIEEIPGGGGDCCPECIKGGILGFRAGRFSFEVIASWSACLAILSKWS